jgi:hypothetical protein
MKHVARILVNIENYDEGFILWNGTESYYKKLRSAYQDISQGKESEYLYFGFFTLCAATLEYSLNFTLTDFCLSEFGMDRYKQYAEGYISLPFGKKLLMTPNIISKGKYRFKEEDDSFKKLLEIISLRNKILHNKEFLKEFNLTDPNKSKRESKLSLEIEIEANHIDRLDKKMCVEYGKALGDFKKYRMQPYLENKLTRNKLLDSM